MVGKKAERDRDSEKIQWDRESETKRYRETEKDWKRVTEKDRGKERQRQSISKYGTLSRKQHLDKC